MTSQDQHPSSGAITRLLNGKIILPDRVEENFIVEVIDGRFSFVGMASDHRLTTSGSVDVEIVDLQGEYLAPGFIDIHVHGGLGADFMDGNPAAIDKGCYAHLRHGVTTLFPTTTTATREQILNVIESVRSVKESPSGKVPLPNIEGIHLYGPYFATEKSGCHRKDACRVPDPAEYLEYFDTGLIRIATCAAELAGADAFYREAYGRGCLVTCGHSNSSWMEMQRAFDCGMRHVDHFWCAMSSVASVRTRFGTPMQGSMLEFVLGNPEMSTEVIADGHHLAPELLRFAWQMKGASRLCIVSDSMRALDMPAGKYFFGDADDGGWVFSDGEVGRTEDGGLASSVTALDQMVRHLIQDVGIPVPDAFRMASLTPAERTGIAGKRGSIGVGKSADFVTLTNQFEVSRVFVEGQLRLTN